MSGPEKRKWQLGEVLIQKGWITWEQLQEALEIQKQLNFTPQEAMNPARDGDGKRKPSLHLGEVLVQHGWLSFDDLNIALKIQDETGRRLGEILLERDLITERNLYRGLAVKAGMPFVDFEKITVAKEALDLVPKHVAYEYRILPLVKHQEVVLIAVANPKDLTFESNLKNHLRGFDMRYSVAPPKDLEHALEQYYGPEMG